MLDADALATVETVTAQTALATQPHETSAANAIATFSHYAAKPKSEVSVPCTRAVAATDWLLIRISKSESHLILCVVKSTRIVTRPEAEAGSRNTQKPLI